MDYEIAMRDNHRIQKRDNQRVRFENEEPRNLKRCHNCKVWINPDGTYANELPTAKGDFNQLINESQ